MKTRKQDYGTANIVGRNIERLRKSRNIKQKDFIAMLHIVIGGELAVKSHYNRKGHCKHDYLFSFG